VENVLENLVIFITFNHMVKKCEESGIKPYLETETSKLVENTKA